MKKRANELHLNQVTVSTTNLERSFDFYKKIGLLPIVKSSHYARFIVPGNEATFSLHIASEVDASTVVYFETENVDEKVNELKQKGFHFVTEPTDQDWQWREAYLNDPDGNKICIYNAGIVRMHPNWRLEDSKNNHHLLTMESFKMWLNQYKSALEQKNLRLIQTLFSDDSLY